MPRPNRLVRTMVTATAARFEGQWGSGAAALWIAIECTMKDFYQVPAVAHKQRTLWFNGLQINIVLTSGFSTTRPSEAVLTWSLKANRERHDRFASRNKD